MIDKEAVRVRNLIKAIGKVTKKRHAAQVLTQNLVRQAETATFEHVIIRSRRPNRINSIFFVQPDGSRIKCAYRSFLCEHKRPICPFNP